MPTIFLLLAVIRREVLSVVPYTACRFEMLLARCTFAVLVVPHDHIP